MFFYFKYLLVLGIFIHSNALGSAYALTFNNFSEKISLKQIGNEYFLMEKQFKVKLANRIIIKSKPNVRKVQIKNEDRHITKVTELYKLKHYIYYLVDIQDSKYLIPIINHFGKLPFIESVQPDILQLKEKLSNEKSHHHSGDYLQRLDISALWKKTKGNNVKIAIIDDGFDLTHEDLKGTMLAFGYDVEMKTLDPTPKLKIDIHGTQIAGIIFARHNHKGIDGIAPQASLIAIRHADTWTSKMILSFYVAKMAGADIINCSWVSKFLLEPISDVIKDLTTEAREGKGIAVVFAAGNNGIQIQPNSNEAALTDVISVGAIDYMGNRLKFSNYGNCVDFFTYGKNIKTTTYSKRKYAFISGTSASAAIVSGLCALILSQNQQMPLLQLNNTLQTILTVK